MVDKSFILTWGIHPEDVAAEKVELGAAIIFNSNDFVKNMDDGEQHLLVSKPTRYISYWITSANAKESDINSYEKFIEYSTKLR